MTFQWNPGQERARANLIGGGYEYNLLYGGSRSGKTFLYCKTILDRALYAPGSDHLVVRQEGTSAKRAIVEKTMPDVIRHCFPGLECVWKDNKGYFLLPERRRIWVGGLNDTEALEKLLGNEYVTIFKNECSEIAFKAHTLLETRLAQQVKTLSGEYMSQRDYNDLNPTTRNHWTYRLWIDGINPEDETPVDTSKYGVEVINPYDNQANLSADYLARLEALPERAKKRFLSGEYVEDVENALWRRSMIRRVQKEPEYQRIVVAVDPAVSSEPGSDETGIVACAIDGSGNGYVLADDSGKYRPEDWARKAIALYDFFGADRVVGEINQGGDMVESVLRSQRPEIPFTGVRATRGKFVRAEPVAALYERGKVFHVGKFEQLEDQMCSITTDFDRKAQGWSPDRVDALVWGFTDLFPSMTRRVSSAPIRRQIGTTA